jgi:hypothetical protein
MYLGEPPKKLQSKINIIFKIKTRGNRNPFDDDRHSHKEHKKKIQVQKWISNTFKRTAIPYSPNCPHKAK